MRARHGPARQAPATARARPAAAALVHSPSPARLVPALCAVLHLPTHFGQWCGPGGQGSGGWGRGCSLEAQSTFHVLGAPALHQPQHQEQERGGVSGAAGCAGGGTRGSPVPWAQSTAFSWSRGGRTRNPRAYHKTFNVLDITSNVCILMYSMLYSVYSTLPRTAQDSEHGKDLQSDAWRQDAQPLCIPW